MWFQRIPGLGKYILLTMGLLLTQCTVTTESNFSVGTSRPSIAQLTPLASAQTYSSTSTTSPTGTEIAAATEIPINVSTPDATYPPVQTATSTPILSAPATVTMMNEER